ncbi:chromosome partitioning protein [Micromonospora sp. SL4-19]|uniref:chromosome partitioning protein n=1 Tax=Micromonospora sp. SL4-19 TaxID=3399129 RepID=UPI003A4E0940
MVHENADRAHGPGQPQVPERDIEPPWPPDPPDPAARSAPDGGSAGPAPDEMRPGTGGGVPAPRAARPPVDLDLPFTLDQPAAGPFPTTPPAVEPGDAVGSHPATTAGQDGETGADPAVGTGAGAGSSNGSGRAESPWAQPPQRSAAAVTEPPGDALPDGATPAPAGTPTAGGPQQGGAPPRLGPFPPSPGVPLQQPPYPPGPVGYGQPATSAHPPPQAGGPAPPPGWYPPGWPRPGAPAPQQPGPPSPQQQPNPAAYPERAWTPESGAPPTAEDFARRRQARPADPTATMGVRAVVNRIGLVRLPPGRHEQELKRDIEMVRRNFGGLRQVTVVNPKGGAGKTVAILLLAMTFGQKRGGYVLAWDNNETQGTLGMRAQQDFHSRTVRDMLRDLGQFQGPHGRVGDLSQYVRSQGEGMFDVLASDESATGGEMLTAAAFAEIRDVVSRFYKLIFVDTGNNVRAQNWQAAMDATDQLVVTMSARNDSAETAARMLDHLEQSGRQRLVRQAVTVVSMPPSRKEIDLPAIQQHFAARTRAVLLAPYERLIDTGEPIRYGQLSSATRDAWLKIAAAVAEGL